LLKERGLVLERSLVEKSRVKDVCRASEQRSPVLAYKHRTYTNLSLPGILGIESWSEHRLAETDAGTPYRMITLSVLTLPSPPMATDLNLQPTVLKLSWT
jgi:hypothetical protein